MQANSSSQIRTDMFPENREPHQHTTVQYIDSILLKAFTAETDMEIFLAKASLSDIQGQCLKHIRWLSELEGVHRECVEKMNGYEINEDEYSELMAFLSAFGESLFNVASQLSVVRK